MMARIDQGTCEHCGLYFGYTILHAGFGDIAYCYCDSCGRLATLSAWDAEAQKLPKPVGWHGEMNQQIEQYL